MCESDGTLPEARLGIYRARSFLRRVDVERSHRHQPHFLIGHLDMRLHCIGTSRHNMVSAAVPP